MAMAMALAERGLGNVWPNPAVGCVLVKDGRVVGRGWTQPGGRPHAESEAIDRAGDAARGSTAYVTLEPCAHHGRTPPCTGLMLAAGIDRVVIAAVDPDPRVNGRGIELLREGGIQVEVGCLETEACRLNAGFFARMRKAAPAGGAQARDQRRRTDCHRHRRQSVDHRAGGTGGGSPSTTAPRCHPGRQRHCPRRRSDADLPPARPGESLAGSGRARSAIAPAAG